MAGYSPPIRSSLERRSSSGWGGGSPAKSRRSPIAILSGAISSSVRPATAVTPTRTLAQARHAMPSVIGNPGIDLTF